MLSQFLYCNVFKWSTLVVSNFDSFVHSKEFNHTVKSHISTQGEYFLCSSLVVMCIWRKDFLKIEYKHMNAEEYYI